MNVAMVMAPNLFMCHTLGLKSNEQREFVMAAGTANIMHLLIKCQQVLWTVSIYFLSSVNEWWYLVSKVILGLDFLKKQANRGDCKCH